MGNITKQFAQWDITSACNLSCLHCRATKLPKKDELSTEEGLKLIKELKSLGVQLLNFSGGEPFLRNDLFKLLDASRDFSVTITTNGTMITPEHIKELTKYHNVRISLSMDGLEEFHDKFRRVPGTFKKAINSIEKLSKAGVKTTAKFTLTKLNLDQAVPAFRFIAQFPILNFNFRSVLPSGRADESLVPTKEEYISVAKALAEESKKLNIPVISGDPILFPLFPQFIGKTWELMGEKVFSELYGGCLAGDEIIYIQPNGDVGVCSYLPDPVGNIRQKSLEEIIMNSERFCSLKNSHEKLSGKCGKCQYKFLCGGCRAAALAMSGQFLGEDPRCLID